MADSVYTWGLTYADIAPRLAEATIGASSDPTSTQVTTWITEVCGIVNSELEALGLTPTAFTSGANANQYHGIRHHIAEYVKSMWLGGNEREATDYVAADGAKFTAMITAIRTLAEHFLGSAMPSRARSHVTAIAMQPVPAALRGASRWFS